MGSRPSLLSCLACIALIGPLLAQAPNQATTSSRPHPDRGRAVAASSPRVDEGVVNNGVYRNKTLGLSCKIPAGWVLRTDEMNEPDDDTDRAAAGNKADGGRVLLAAFSRPPAAQGAEVNSSILIAAESAAAYPGLTDAAQYFGPLTEVAKAQGFTVDEEPYEIEIGPKTLVRGDFHKDVGTRVMRQSTLAMLAHGYAVSITVIGGTEDEVEELIDGLEFTGSGHSAKPK